MTKALEYYNRRDGLRMMRSGAISAFLIAGAMFLSVSCQEKDVAAYFGAEAAIGFAEEEERAVSSEVTGSVKTDTAQLPAAEDVKSALYAFLSEDPSIALPQELKPVREKYKKFGILRRRAMTDFYNQRNFAPVWSKDGKMTPRAEALRDAINETLFETGPYPDNYFRPYVPGKRYTDVAAFEIAFTSDVLDYLYKFGNGFTAARVFARGEGEDSDKRPLNYKKALRDLASARPPREIVETYEPQTPEYANLKKALRKLANRSVALIQAKDGKLTPQTKTYAKNIEKILINLERLRHIAANGNGDGVTVNIPEYKLRVRENGREIFESPVIVGRKDRKTPIFNDKISYVEFNPYWNVPYKLAVRDLLPKLKRDPGYARRKNIKIFRGSALVNPNKVNWKLYSQKNFPFTLRQDPGPYNALGTVKFMFPNKYAVYLHDTPQKYLFKRAARYQSSGCVRVAKPRQLAYVLFKGKLTPKQTDYYFKLRKNRQVTLPRKRDIRLIYLTARADAEGNVTYSDDIYGYDPPVAAALRGLR